MYTQWQSYGGSVAGDHHLLRDRPNQDAYSIVTEADFVAAVVCDGCSGGTGDTDNGVGATLASHIVVQALRDERALLTGLSGDVTAADLQPYLDRVTGRVMTLLGALAEAMGGCQSEIVGRYFLFTVVVAIVTPSFAAICVCGDGLFAINGKEQRLGPYPGNAPPYLGYGLLPASLALHELAQPLTAVCVCPTHTLTSLAIASDGAIDFAAVSACSLPGTTEPLGPLHQFWTEERYRERPYLLARRLARANRRARQTGDPRLDAPRLLPDDTTIVVMVRRGTCDDEESAS